MDDIIKQIEKANIRLQDTIDLIEKNIETLDRIDKLFKDLLNAPHGESNTDKGFPTNPPGKGET